MKSLAGVRSIWKHMSILLDLCWVFPRLSQLVFLVSLPSFTVICCTFFWACCVSLLASNQNWLHML